MHHHAYDNYHSICAAGHVSGRQPGRRAEVSAASGQPQAGSLELHSANVPCTDCHRGGCGRYYTIIMMMIIRVHDPMPVTRIPLRVTGRPGCHWAITCKAGCAPSQSQAQAESASVTVSAAKFRALTATQ